MPAATKSVMRVTLTDVETGTKFQLKAGLYPSRVIDAYMRYHEWSDRDLAFAAGVHPQTVERARTADPKKFGGRWITCTKILNALGLNVHLSTQ